MRIMFVFLLAVTVQAQEPHRYWDREAKWTVAAESTAAAADMAYTCVNLANGGREYSLPTQNCGKAVAMMAGFHVAANLVSWQLHRWKKHRLERWPRIYMVGANVFGVISTAKRGN